MSNVSWVYEYTVQDLAYSAGLGNEKLHGLTANPKDKVMVKWAVEPQAPLTLPIHPHLEAFEQAAVLAPVPLLPRHNTVLVTTAPIHPLVANAPLEKPLAALTGDDPIVQACSTVPTNEAGPLFSPIIWNRN